VLTRRQKSRKQLQSMIDNRKLDEKDSRTIFGDLLNSNLPPAEKSIDRMWHDGQVFNIAGSETTSWALGNCTYYLLTNPKMLKRLQEELKTVIPDGSVDDIASSELEALPYLVCYKFNGRDSWLIIVQTAVIKESLRLSFGVAGRLYRISPDKTQVLRDGAKEWVIPAGVGFPFLSTNFANFCADPSRNEQSSSKPPPKGLPFSSNLRPLTLVGQSTTRSVPGGIFQGPERMRGVKPCMGRAVLYGCGCVREVWGRGEDDEALEDKCGGCSGCS